MKAIKYGCGSTPLAAAQDDLASFTLESHDPGQRFESLGVLARRAKEALAPSSSAERQLQLGWSLAEGIENNGYLEQRRCLRNRQRASKVAMREICAGLQLFRQPSWIDAAPFFAPRIETLARCKTEDAFGGRSFVFLQPPGDMQLGFQEQLVAGLLALNHAFYIKPACGSAGFLVTRVERFSSGRYGCMSDDESFLRLIEKGRNLIGDICRISEFEGRDQLILKEEEMKAFLKVLLRSCHPAIIESEIPGLPGISGKREIRMIGQSIDGTWTISGVYGRRSRNNVAVNRSLGGEAVSCETLLGELCDSFGLCRSQVPDRLAQLQSEASFLLDFFALVHSRIFKAAAMTDLSIDLCPVWNPERGDFDFWLGEIQEDYGMQGLEEVAPETAAIVRKNRK